MAFKTYHCEGTVEGKPYKGGKTDRLKYLFEEIDDFDFIPGDSVTIHVTESREDEEDGK